MEKLEERVTYIETKLKDLVTATSAVREQNEINHNIIRRFETILSNFETSITQITNTIAKLMENNNNNNGNVNNSNNSNNTNNAMNTNNTNNTNNNFDNIKNNTNNNINNNNNNTSNNKNNKKSYAEALNSMQIPKNRKRPATIRALQPTNPNEPKTNNHYAQIHLHRNRRINRRELRKFFSSINVDNGRILDITFPAKETITILIHEDFKDELTQILKNNNIKTDEKFNPLDEKHVADIRFQTLNKEQRSDIAHALQRDRCIRTLQFIRPYLLPSISKYFESQNWINSTISEAAIQQRFPEYHRNKIRRSNNFQQSTQQNQSNNVQRYDYFGNPVTTNHIETSEEFAPDADKDEDMEEEETTTTQNPDTTTEQ